MTTTSTPARSPCCSRSVKAHARSSTSLGAAPVSHSRASPRVKSEANNESTARCWPRFAATDSDGSDGDAEQASTNFTSTKGDIMIDQLLQMQARIHHMRDALIKEGSIV